MWKVLKCQFLKKGFPFYVSTSYTNWQAWESSASINTRWERGANATREWTEGAMRTWPLQRGDWIKRWREWERGEDCEWIKRGWDRLPVGETHTISKDRERRKLWNMRRKCIFCSFFQSTIVCSASSQRSQIKSFTWEWRLLLLVLHSGGLLSLFPLSVCLTQAYVTAEFTGHLPLNLVWLPLCCYTPLGQQLSTCLSSFPANRRLDRARERAEMREHPAALPSPRDLELMNVPPLFCIISHPPFPLQLFSFYRSLLERPLALLCFLSVASLHIS